MRSIRTPRELGLAIRRARSDRSWTQAELAERARVGRPWLSELEGGKRTAELGRVLAVLEALQLTVTLVPAETGLGKVDLDDLL
ncbi:MAG: helix-turn-helix transcriptional regulator [Acidimicrobiia bacterium]|nr:helix-turn-helix transcriptional regulator [Acidimicrobiia bacterium]